MNSAATDRLFFNRILELANRSFSQNVYTFTPFLDVLQLNLLHQLQKDLAFTSYTLFGGIDGTTRQMVRFGDSNILGYEQSFPITCICITPTMKKFAGTLTHRDYLGALMNLGIERETVGDLIVKDQDCYIFCMENMADFIITELSKVKNTSVKCFIPDTLPTETLLKLESKELLASSERLDLLISKLLNLSRTKVNLIFQEKKIFVNGRLCENTSYVLKKDDILVIRGVGKFIYKGIVAQTKKDKLRVEFAQYV